MVFFTRIYISHVQCRMGSWSLHRIFVDLIYCGSHLFYFFEGELARVNLSPKMKKKKKKEEASEGS